MKAKRLGRGLTGLIKTTDEAPAEKTVDRAATPPASAAPADAASKRRSRKVAPPVASTRAGAPPERGGVKVEPSAEFIAVTKISPNPFQPREIFNEDALADLAASIKEHGLIQPVVLRRGITGYELVAGERRWRAAQLAGLETIPALVRSATDAEMQTLALVENIQREDLNAIEKARALRAMMRNLALTQDETAQRVGKARATIANMLRLLDLPKAVQTMVEAGTLRGAQARALLRAKTDDARLRLATRAVSEGWSVREIERRTAGEKHKAPARATPTRTENPYLAEIEERLAQALGTKVLLRPKGDGGTIEVVFHDARDLDRILDQIES